MYINILKFRLNWRGKSFSWGGDCRLSMPMCNWVIWAVLCRMNSPSIRGIIIAYAIQCYFHKQLVHKMSPSSVILTGAGSTLDLQVVELLKPESRLLKHLTRYKIIFQLHGKWPKLSQMNTCSILHSSYINGYTASTLSTYKNIGQEACPYSVHTKNISQTCIRKAKAKSS